MFEVERQWLMKAMKATFIEDFKSILLNVRKAENVFVKESPKPL